MKDDRLQTLQLKQDSIERVMNISGGLFIASCIWVAVQGIAFLVAASATDGSVTIPSLAYFLLLMTNLIAIAVAAWFCVCLFIEPKLTARIDAQIDEVLDH